MSLNDTWILPIPHEVYRTKDAMNELRFIEWPRVPEFQPRLNDTVYIYLPSPDSAIRFRAQVIKVDVVKDNIRDRSYWVNREPYEHIVYHSHLKLMREVPEGYLSLKDFLRNGLFDSYSIKFPINLTDKSISTKSNLVDLKKFIDTVALQLLSIPSN